MLLACRSAISEKPYLIMRKLEYVSTHKSKNFFLTLSIIYVRHSDSSHKKDWHSNHLLTVCTPKVIQGHYLGVNCSPSILQSSNVLQLIISYSHVTEVLEIFSFSLQTSIMCNTCEGHGMSKFYRLSQLVASS
jgi:hypothetical protein